MQPEHVCTYTELREKLFTRDVGGVQYTEVTEYRACVCGQAQPRRANRVRTPKRRLLRVAKRVALPVTPSAQRLARAIFRKPAARWETIARPLRADLPPGELHQALLHLVRTGIIEVEERGHPQWEPYAVTVVDPQELQELATPGRIALETDVRKRISALPKSTRGRAEVLESLGTARPLDDAALEWAARVVEHGARGAQSMVRAFSGSHAGTKDFYGSKARVESLLGPLDLYGILDPELRAVLFGDAILSWGDRHVTLWPELGPVGLSLRALNEIESLQTQHLFLVENRELVEACAAGRLALPVGCLVMETMGHPGAAILHVPQVSTCGVSVWADLDAAGIRTAQAIIDATGGRAQPLNMEPHWLERANRETTNDTWKDAERLQHLAPPLGLLATRIVATKTWLEQEAQLAAISGLVQPTGSVPMLNAGGQ